MNKDEKFRIAFLDDRPEQLETVVRGIRPFLPSSWECIECQLLPSATGYSSWILEENVLVLLVDQILNERAASISHPVDYKGHDVISEVRKKLPEFPIVVVTKAIEDVDLQANFGEADAIISRSELLAGADKYIKRIIRLGMRFLNQFQEELSELTDISEKIATGKATVDEVEKIKSIQAKLSVSYPVESMKELDSSLSIFHEEIQKLEFLKKDIEAFLGKE